MRRNAFFSTPRWALHRALAVVFILAARTDAAEFLEQANQALSIQDPQHSFDLQLSGLIDFEGYFIDQRPPALIDSGDKFLFNPRVTLFADLQWTSHFYVFAQARLDRGFDPSDGGANMRMDEYFLRFTPLDSSTLNFQFGKFATVVGNWVQRHYSWDNPFINAPLAYENLVGIWDSEAAPNGDTVLYWAHVNGYESGDYSDKHLRLPVIWGPSYASGVSVFGTVDRFDYAAEIKNASLSSRPEQWDLTARGFDQPTISARVGFRPDAMWNIGCSVSTGSYLMSDARPTLRPGSNLNDYREEVLGQDISFAWHHLQLWSEVYEARFTIPGVGNADTLAYYLEAKYKVTTQLFAALRWNQQLYADLPTSTGEKQWGSDTWRVDAAVGYRFTNYLQAKVQYSFTHQDSDVQVGEQLVAVQLTFKY